MCNCSEHKGADATSSVGEGVTFQVDDMTCDHCAGTIRKAIAQSMPEAEVMIDLNGKRVTVKGDAAMAQSTISAAGYTPQLATI